MRALITILAISAGSLLVGAAILGVFVGGPVGVLGAPLLAAFGWFFFFPILVFVSIFWVSTRPLLTAGAPRYLFMLCGAALGAAFMGYFGIKEEGRILRDTLGYVTGGGVSGGAAVWCITRLHPSARRRNANENQMA